MPRRQDFGSDLAQIFLIFQGSAGSCEADDGKLTSSCHCKFYRVVAVGDLLPGPPQTITLELATNVQDFAAATATAQFVVLPDVVDVIEMGQLSKVSNN